ncbi:imidazoleglycerol-phosphate dehydratase HisB [Rhodopirellula sp. JC740]|uniref:Imidazoleglycerol-phosphate dehydratase n=1 Tax=Rhodopirellula halodulae TaxID=2894198 RepID=A0ABS8NL35_9BACT|nr:MULTISPECIES: imidazoleglycerol-phosphate dehydratase HisB [unclassified Rhodopirellula]MCC9644270.1 imidazoleglycerol-phosphate dehydratase HisB [Rhodopirellula sp. JC740]MCC9657432.1 imidazoleglycerol-phosphate dehydratase HisB [Rhodopirellula sp. JC737]
MTASQSTPNTPPRQTTIERKTGETDIKLSINLDGSGSGQRNSGIGFLDHMLDLLAKHSLIDLTVEAKGDLHVDDHHTAEDIGIALGTAVDQALGNRAGVRRYGHFTLPMDECLVTSAVDMGGRYAFEYNAPIAAPKIGTFDSELVEHFWQSFAVNAKCNLHVLLHHGRNAHHISECVFKATARAIRMAVENDPRSDAIPSTKGVL